MLKYLKYFFFIIVFLVVNRLFHKVLNHFNPDEDSIHVIKVRKSDGTIEYFKHGVLINLDTTHRGENFDLAESFSK